MVYRLGGFGGFYQVKKVVILSIYIAPAGSTPDFLSKLSYTFMGKTDLPFELVNVEFRLTTMLSLVIQSYSLLVLPARLAKWVILCEIASSLCHPETRVFERFNVDRKIATWQSSGSTSRTVPALNDNIHWFARRFINQSFIYLFLGIASTFIVSSSFDGYLLVRLWVL